MGKSVGVYPARKYIVDISTGDIVGKVPTDGRTWRTWVAVSIVADIPSSSKVWRITRMECLVQVNDKFRYP